MTAKTKATGNIVDFGSLLSVQQDPFRQLLREALQEVLEADMTEALGASASQRSDSRVG